MPYRPLQFTAEMRYATARVILGCLVFALVLAVSGGTGLAAHPSAAVVLQASSPTVFAVIGDYGTDNSNESAVQTLVNGWSPSFIVTVGDNFYNSAINTGDTGNKYHESVGKYFCRYLKDVAGAGTCPTGTAAVNALFPAMGNHDYSDATPAPGTYTSYFTLPGANVPSNNSSGNERYYDVIEGPVHFFVINSNTAEPDGTSSTSVQARWLQAQLGASTSTWNIVLFHHPPYSSDTEHGSTTYMQWPFAQWGADAVVSGHAHDYERILRDGIVYFVNGLGGAPHYGFGTPVAGSAFRYNANGGAQRVTATDTSLTFEFISVDGVVQDTYTVTANGAATSTPPPTTAATPTLAATPTATAVPATGQTMSFQNGSAPSASYAGSDDTYLSQANPGTNYGGASTCLADGDDPPGTGNDLSCLLRWDVSAIPAGSTVTGASITLNVTNASAGSYPIYQVLQPWREAEATWNVYATRLPWNIAGAEGSLDRGTTSLGAIAPSSTGPKTVPLNAAGLAVLQSWIDTPGTNEGLIVANSTASDGADFSSTESGTVANRPKLTVQYAPPAVAVPTATPTTAPSTATPTPNATATQAPSATQTASPTQTATATATTALVHVGNLDGATSKTANAWTASVTITAHDAVHGPLAGAAVTGDWSAGAAGASACTTGADGTCTLTLSGLPPEAKSVQFTVSMLAAAGASYDPTANHDVDGETDGTTITVSW